MTDMQFIQIPERGLITVEGADRRAFLQGLISNDIARTDSGQAIWAALLTPQGKFRHDFFLFAEEDRFVIECEGGNRLMDLGQALRRFVLRDDVKLGIDTKRKSYAIYGNDIFSHFGSSSRAGEMIELSNGTAFVDPRDTRLGIRLIAEPSVAETFFTDNGITEGQMTDFETIRISRGIPDGSRDMQLEKALLMESGFDELGGVDWQKGCYMGQELTARTKYRGLVKKRLLPVSFDGPALESGTAIELDGKPIGEIRSSVDGQAIALIRLDGLAKSQDTGNPLSANGIALTVTVPDWVKLPEKA